MADRKDSKGRLLKTGESQRTDGRYQFRFKPQGSNVYKVVYSNYLTASDARGTNKKSLRELEEDIRKNNLSIVNRTNLTVKQLLEKYIKLKPKLALSTAYNYEKLKDNTMSLHPLGEMRIQDVKKSNILDFYNFLSTERHYKNSTINMIQNVLFPAFQMAVDDEIIIKNPCKDCTKDYQKNDSKEKVALTNEEQEIFLKFVETSNVYKRYYPMFLIAFETGLRCGELLGLTWDDINYEDGYIDINHQMLYRKLDGHYQYLITDLKSKAAKRQLPLNDRIERALKLQKQWQWEQGINRFPEKTITVKGYNMSNRGNLIFTSKAGTPYKGVTIDRALVSIIRDYNYSVLNVSKVIGEKPKFLPHLSIHMLRHTACTNWARKGMDVKVLQYIMGHANIQVTMDVYNHVSMERVQEEAKRMYQVQDKDRDELNLELSALYRGSQSKNPTARNKIKAFG